MTEIIAAVTLGLGSGLAPGPLQSLILTTSLRRGFGAGGRVAVAPLFTDVVIVGAAIALVSSLPSATARLLGIAGGVLVIAMGVWEVRSTVAGDISAEIDGGGPRDVIRGALVNLVNPHPWLFWVAAGAPLVIDMWRRSPGRAVAFMVTFYVCLVGSKVALAYVVAAGRKRLSPLWLRRMTISASALLVASGVLLIVNFA